MLNKHAGSEPVKPNLLRDYPTLTIQDLATAWSFVRSRRSEIDAQIEANEGVMRQTFDAIFDGSVFRPDQPIELEPNTRVRITIEPNPTFEKERQSFLEVARSLNLDGPRDWSSRLDEYLYGGNVNL